MILVPWICAPVSVCPGERGRTGVKLPVMGLSGPGTGWLHAGNGWDHSVTPTKYMNKTIN